MKIILSLLIILYFYIDLFHLNNIIYFQYIISKNQSDLFSKNFNSIFEPFINQQKEFCDNFSKYYNEQIEKEIQLLDIDFYGLSYKIFTHKIKSGITLSIINNKTFEKNESINIIEALKYYAEKKNILNNKDIVMLDIGGNMGWYPSLLGKFDYTILTFEPLPQNYYISKRNYCLLNKNSNVIIITKGISTEEKICDYYKDIYSFSNGMTLCNEERNMILNNRFQKIGKVHLTQLNNFIPYLSHKNIALIKIDVEGSEGKVIKSGIELITKYHVPFIFIEFSPKFLIEHKTNPKRFLKLFIDNGYKISLEGFLNKNYISVKELIKKTTIQSNCYFIYKKIIE